MTIPATSQFSAVASASEPAPAFLIDAQDPLARWIRGRLGWGWPQVLVAALVIYGPLEKFIIPAAGGYLRLSGTIGQWSPDVVALLTGFVVYPFILAFYMWTGHGIGDLFVSLWRNKSFADMEAYAAFMSRAQTSFNRQRWSALSLAISLIITLIVHVVLWGPGSEFLVWFGPGNVLHRAFALMLIALVGYAVGQIVIRQTLAITWLLRLLSALGQQLVIHPYHVDGAGGLGAIGRYAVRFSFLLLAVMIYFIGGSLLPSLQVGEKLALSLRNPALILAWVFYIVLVPGTFISLLLPAHFAMTAVRNAQLSLVSAQLDEQLQLARASTADDRSQLPDILKQVEHLKSMRSLILQDFPTWPVSVEIRRQIGASTVIPPAAHFLITLALNILSP